MTTEIGFAVAFAAGVLSFLSPCVLPLVPSYVSFVAGVGVEELEAGDSEVQRTAFLHSLVFVLGFSAVFMGLGASASYLGQLLSEHRAWITRIGGAVVVLFGMHLQRKPLGYVGTFLVGVTFGAGWAPCIGPVLGGILTFAATREGLAEGVQLLGVYSAGLAVPFLIASSALSWFLSASRRFRRWLPWVERASGALLILVGVLLLSGQFTVLARWATQFTPDFILQNI